MQWTKSQVWALAMDQPVDRSQTRCSIQCGKIKRKDPNSILNYRQLSCIAIRIWKYHSFRRYGPSLSGTHWKSSSPLNAVGTSFFGCQQFPKSPGYLQDCQLPIKTVVLNNTAGLFQEGRPSARIDPSPNCCVGIGGIRRNFASVLGFNVE